MSWSSVSGAKAATRRSAGTTSLRSAVKAAEPRASMRVAASPRLSRLSGGQLSPDEGVFPQAGRGMQEAVERHDEVLRRLADRRRREVRRLDHGIGGTHGDQEVAAIEDVGVTI